MPHVDEGALHAYLDGALDEYPLEEAARIRAHVESCAECAARLEEEARVRDEAGRVLAMAAPAVEAPPLEALRARARARGAQRRSLGRLQRLGWAASVVLALGTGWLLRGVQPPAPATTAVPVQSPERGPTAEDVEAATPLAAIDPVAGVDPAASAGAGPGAGAGRVAQDAARAAREAANAAEPAPPPAVPVQPEALPDAAERTVAADAAPKPSAAESVATLLPDSAPPVGTALGPELRSTQEARRAVDTRELERQRREGAVLRTGAAAPALAPAVAAPAVAEPSAFEDRVEAEATRSLVVPGLEVLSVEWLEAGAPPMTVRVLQRLGSGETLEVLHLPAGSDPSALGAREADGRAELIVPREDGGYLILRAAVDGETLAGLAARIGTGG